MTPEEIAVKLAEVDARSRSNTHRLDRMEADFEALNKLATAMEVMAEKMDYQAETVSRIEADVNSIGQKVDSIEKKPGKRWEGIVEKFLYGLVGALAAALFAGALTLMTAGVAG